MKSPSPRLKLLGTGLILCNWCAWVIKQNITPQERKGITDKLFCSEECRQKFIKTHSSID